MRISILVAAAKDCGITGTTNHNKAAEHGWSISLQVSQSRHHTVPVSHIRWHQSAASADPVTVCR